MTIERLDVEHVEEVVPLFGLYRVFYQKAYDANGARQFLTERLQNEESVIFVAKQNGQPVGFTQLYPTFSSVSMSRAWILNDLYVDEMARGTGVGFELLKTAKQFVREQNAAYVQLSTAHDNYTAQSLYERFGFVEDKEFKTYVLDCR